MTFEDAGFVLAPPGAAIVCAGPSWTTQAPGDEPLVWGNLAHPPAPTRSLLGWAARRERALRRMPGHVRLLPTVLQPLSARSRLTAVVRAGAIVEHRPPGTRRRIDVVAERASVVVRDVAVGAGGGVRATGTDAIVRAGRAATAGDPSTEAAALRSIAGRGIPAPNVTGAGVDDGVSWCAETLLAGTRPERLDDALAELVAGALSRMPRGDDPARAFVDDIALLARELPALATNLQSLRDDVAASLSKLPAVARHGDMWAGNLLVEHGALTGIVDWDAFHPSAAAGADLLQLVANQMRLDARRGVGATWLTRPERSKRFASLAAPYWRALDAPPPGPRELFALAVSWWAAEIAGSLRRMPTMAQNDGWVAANVQAVLTARP